MIKLQELLDFGYPGGPKVDKLAKEGEPKIKLPKTHFKDSLDFSFSGIKTAVINANHNIKNINKADLCASFQKTVTDVLIENISIAIEKTKSKKIAIAGGVSANSYIRNAFLNLPKNYENLQIYMPDIKLCTDNGAMIASAGYYNFIKGFTSELSLNAEPSLKLE